MRHTQPATIVSHAETHALARHPLAKNSLSKPPLLKKNSAEKTQTDGEVNRADADLFSALSHPMPMWTDPTTQGQQAIQPQYNPQRADHQGSGKESQGSGTHTYLLSQQSSQQSSLYPTSLLSSSVNDTMVFDTAIQKIAEPLIPETNALECVLLLPRLGEVQLKASQSEQQWHLQLTFMRPAALDYVQKRQATLTQRLSERLGSPVILALSSREKKASREQQASHEENELED